MKAVAVFSPAKINLCLGLTGRRADGFHSLYSAVATLCFGDHLWAAYSGSGGDVLECGMPGVPTDGSNLVLKAAQAFREATGLKDSFHFTLEKAIPPGSGLGGGSSNAVAAWRALEALTGRRVPTAMLAKILAELGSDCPLFLQPNGTIMRGRGEILEDLPAGWFRRLREYRVLLAIPGFSIDTAWAYRRFTAGGGCFREETELRARVEGFAEGTLPVEDLLTNDFEPVVAGKYLAFAEAIHHLREHLRIPCLLSGSGSAFFCLISREEELRQAECYLKVGFGKGISCIGTRFTSPFGGV